MIVKKRMNNTNYVLQKSARSHPFVVHVDWMRQFHSNLFKHVVKDPSHSQDSSPQPTGAD